MSATRKPKLRRARNAKPSRNNRQVVRETFSLSRTLEYFSEAELTKQIGYPRQLWLLAIVKELVDNALDNCEEHGILPEVTITLTANSLSVRDNGTGIPPETVAKMLDFTKRVSSREAYRGAPRGSQGNAGKCILGCPYVLNDGAGKVTIIAQSQRHEITVTLDPLDHEPKVDHRQTDEKVKNGTSVEVHIAELASILDDDDFGRFLLLGKGYIALNPHLTLTLELPDGTRHKWTRRSDAIKKWTPAEPEVAGWHNDESFARLVGACIKRDQELRTDRLLPSFLQQFAGLKGSNARKAVCDETGLTRCKLSALVNSNGLDRNRTSLLLGAMQRHGSMPKPEKLGGVGRATIKSVFSNFGVTGEVKHKKLTGFSNDLPFVVEAAFAELEDTEGEPIIITGCNYTPSIDQPVVRMLDSLLADQMVDDEAEVVVLLHIVTVAPTYLDRGKRMVDVGGHLKEAIDECVVSVTTAYRTLRKAEERDAASLERRIQRQSRSRHETTLKDAIVTVLPEATTRASGSGACEFSDRDWYYAARELVQKLTDHPLTQSYFDKVVDQWEIDNGLIPGRLRDPKGFFQEPHTKRRIPLGTKAVDEYEIPAHLYDKIIYVEKKGLLPKFQLGQIGERFDAGIICAEGYAVRAAKALIQAAQSGHKMKVLCFHDADPDGYNIWRTLSEATGAHRYEIEVIDAGLHLAEALEMGLAVETFVRKKALPKELTLSDLELEYFTGKARLVTGKNGKPKTHWVNCRRVELNALSADPQKFIEWVERKLAEHGVAKKLVPPKKIIVERAEAEREAILRRYARRCIEETLAIDAKVDEIVEQLLRQVKIDAVPGAVKKWGSKSGPGK